jgi:alpha-glucoside transport system permease protein
MVIFSAAIKAVPGEFIEAAKVDGATESQTFFSVTLPSILPTVGVVVTTMIVQVTKVYDIVAVAGLGGRFGNNVLANQMFNESFQIGDTGLGAAIAIVMFLVVLPVMVYNIYNMQKEAI